VSGKSPRKWRVRDQLCAHHTTCLSCSVWLLWPQAAFGGVTALTRLATRGTMGSITAFSASGRWQRGEYLPAQITTEAHHVPAANSGWAHSRTSNTSREVVYSARIARTSGQLRSVEPLAVKRRPCLAPSSSGTRPYARRVTSQRYSVFAPGPVLHLGPHPHDPAQPRRLPLAPRGPLSWVRHLGAVRAQNFRRRGI